MRAIRAVCLTATAVAVTTAAVGCGSDTSSSKPAAAPTASAPSMSMGMSALASTTQGDMKVGLDAMAPETFYVAEGSAQRKQAPTKQDTAHMMVTLADAKTGIRLPDASVTLQITAPDGRSAFDGPLYPMIGRGMGMHYGENVPLGAAGTYTAKLVAGPPRIGRHMDSAGAWSKTTVVTQRFSWDGKTAKAIA